MRATVSDGLQRTTMRGSRDNSSIGAGLQSEVDPSGDSGDQTMQERAGVGTRHSLAEQAPLLTTRIVIVPPHKHLRRV